MLNLAADQKRRRGMEAESRKRGREEDEEEVLEMSESSSNHQRVKKRDVTDGCRGGGADRDREGEGEEEVEDTGRGVFDFPWLKGEGMMTEEEWKEATFVVSGDGEEGTFLGTLARCCRESEEAGILLGQGMPLLEDTGSTSSSTSSAFALSLGTDEEEEELMEEYWGRGRGRGRDDVWSSILH